MRAAMANARVGDDVYGEDPTVIELQNYAADLLGKEAALYMPTATMSNVCAVLTHCARGDELIVSKKAHIFLYEQGGAAQLGGVNMYTIDPNFEGELPLVEISAAIRADDPHYPRTALICLENTAHGRGGTPITPKYMAEVADLAEVEGLKVHLDGARLFNAAAALNVHPRELAAGADTVQLCLSKGLCAPLGSLLLGPRDFINRALRVRKVLGGGMRQVGVVAAAGLVALRDMRDRLVEDHKTAQLLAEGLAAIPGIKVDPVHIRTNMVFFTIPEYVYADPFVEMLKERGVILRGGPHFRLVTHYWITPEKVMRALAAIRDVIEAAKTFDASTNGQVGAYQSTY
jgi:threonine aldolase